MSTHAHPVSILPQQDKYRIYYTRIVDLAVLFGLLTPDPNTEIGHFAFSAYYYEGKALDVRLREAIREFERQCPELILERRVAQNQQFAGAAEEYINSDAPEKLRDLIRVGASFRVWPTGTTFALTYPWDLDGNGRPVRFRDDLSVFMKRRIVEILRKAGKLRSLSLFGNRVVD